MNLREEHDSYKRTMAKVHERGRREAIEECAKVAESHFYLSDGFRRWKSGEEIASRIRSLLHAAPDGKK